MAVSAYITWAATQAAARVIPWVATHPTEVALATIGFYYERKLTTDLIWGYGSVVWRSIVGGTGPGIIQTTAQALNTRWPQLGKGATAVKQVVTKNPATVTAVALTTIGIAYSETSDEAGGFASPASSGIGLSPTQTAGKGSIGRRLDKLFSLSLRA